MAATHEWTPEDDAQLRQLRADGTTTTAIGLHFGVHRDTAQKRIKFLQLTGPRLKRRSAEWPAEKDARLTELWADKTLSAAEIGGRMGISKNAVLGRVHRLHLPARPSPIRTDPIPKRIARRRPIPKLATLESLKTPTRPYASLRCVSGGRRTLIVFPVGAARTCQYIAGEAAGADTQFCGLPSNVGSSYCDFHHRLCHVRIRAWEDAA